MSTVNIPICRRMSDGDGAKGADGLDAPRDGEVANARIAVLEAELAQMRDQWLRSEAEVANVRARAKRDVDEARQYATQKFAVDVVEAAENLQRGLETLPATSAVGSDSIARIRDSLSDVERNFVRLLERNGIRKEDPTGSAFDPNFHQALAEEDTTRHPPGTVLHARTPTWTLNGRLLRPAMVVVEKTPKATSTVSGFSVSRAN